MAHESRDAEMAPSADSHDASSELIERERDLLKIREDAARGVDVQAAAITAATLALVAVAASGDAVKHANRGWIIAAGILLLLSALAGGIARLPAPPPLKAIVMPQERKRVLRLYASDSGVRLRGLGRYLGKQIRDSEDRLQEFTLETKSEMLMNELLAHWRARNWLARYRMHSKSAWFTLSLVLLYLAVLLIAAGFR